MGDTERVQVEDSGCNLVSDVLCPVFGYLEVLGLQIVEEIAASEVFHDDVNVVAVFENIIESNDIWMLADFKNLDFSLEQLNIF